MTQTVRTIKHNYRLMIFFAALFIFCRFEPSGSSQYWWNQVAPSLVWIHHSSISLHCTVISAFSLLLLLLPWGLSLLVQPLFWKSVSVCSRNDWTSWHHWRAFPLPVRPCTQNLAAWTGTGGGASLWRKITSFGEHFDLTGSKSSPSLWPVSPGMQH